MLKSLVSFWGMPCWGVALLSKLRGLVEIRLRESRAFGYLLSVFILAIVKLESPVTGPWVFVTLSNKAG
jgi:hypothetical protein